MLDYLLCVKSERSYMLFFFEEKGDYCYFFFKNYYIIITKFTPVLTALKNSFSNGIYWSAMIFFILNFAISKFFFTENISKVLF
jgi:hypothetical protein